MPKPPPKKNFGPHIRKLREDKGISLRKFAAKVGMSPTYLSKVERGDVPPPGEEKLLALATHLGVNEDALIFLAGRIPSQLLTIIRSDPMRMASLLRDEYDGPPLSKLVKPKTSDS